MIYGIYVHTVYVTAIPKTQLILENAVLILEDKFSLGNGGNMYISLC